MKKKRKTGRKLLGFSLALAMVVGLMPGMSLTALAAKQNVYFPLEVTGYNVDVIADGSKSGDELKNSVNNYVDEMNNGGCFAFFAGGNDSGKIPDDGKVTTTTGIDFQLGAFNSNNTLQLTGGNREGSLTLENPQSGYNEIAILCTGGGGETAFSITPVYNDSEGTTSSATAPDWYYGNGIVLKCSRIKANLVDGDNAYLGKIESNDSGPGMYEVKANLDPTKTLESIKFQWSGGVKLNIFAASVVAAEAYQVTFNPNGGTGTMEDQYIPSGAKPKPNTFKKGTRKFDGWDTKEDGTGIRYKENDPITLDHDLTLYAQWKYISLDENTPIVIKKGDTELTDQPMVGDKLSVSCEASDLAYEWFVDDVSRGTATETNTDYTVTLDDVGKKIKVKAYQITKENDQPYVGDCPTKESDSTLAVGLSEETINKLVTLLYADETATPKTGWEISTDGQNPETLTDGTFSLTNILDTSDTPTIYVRKAATGGTNAGKWCAVPLKPRPEAPTGVGSTGATDTDTADGVITGVDSTMEYSTDDGVTWTAVTQTTITGLIPGTYLIRTKATDSVPHGKSTEVTVGSREIILSDGQKPTAKTGLTTNGSKQVLLNGAADGLPEGAEKIQYALGTDENTVPTEGWSEEIPTATDAGTYYVWYKVVGDGNHNDTDEFCVSVTINTKSSVDRDITAKQEDGAKTATGKATVSIPNADGQGATDQPSGEPALEEAAALSLNAGFKVSQTGSKITVKWGRVEEADGYDVYVTYCGDSFANKKPAKTVNTNNILKAKITRINGKKINLKKNFKVYIAAYKMVDGKKEQIAKTITGHVVGRKNTKYSNARKIKITSKTKLAIGQGKTSRIEAKTVLVTKGKKQLSDAHAKEFRYASSNKAVATVDKNGKVTGVAKGTCTIYVYARNGYARKVSVTVK